MPIKSKSGSGTGSELLCNTAVIDIFPTTSVDLFGAYCIIEPRFIGFHNAIKHFTAQNTQTRQWSVDHSATHINSSTQTVPALYRRNSM